MAKEKKWDKYLQIDDWKKDEGFEDVKEETMPSEWEQTKPDNRIIGTAIKNHAILVTSDISMLLKAEAINVSTELFRNETVSDASIQ